MPIYAILLSYTFEILHRCFKLGLRLHDLLCHSKCRYQHPFARIMEVIFNINMYFTHTITCSSKCDYLQSLILICRPYVGLWPLVLYRMTLQRCQSIRRYRIFCSGVSLIHAKLCSSIMPKYDTINK